MSTTPKDGGPIAANLTQQQRVGSGDGCYYEQHTVLSAVGGLSKREYFAAMAMQGLLASMGDHCVTADKIAEFSVGHADNLLEALSQEVAP